MRWHRRHAIGMKRMEGRVAGSILQLPRTRLGLSEIAFADLLGLSSRRCRCVLRPMPHSRRVRERTVDGPRRRRLVVSEVRVRPPVRLSSGSPMGSPFS